MLSKSLIKGQIVIVVLAVKRGEKGKKSRIMRKSPYGAFNQAQHKLRCTATEDTSRLEI